MLPELGTLEVRYNVTHLRAGRGNSRAYTIDKLSREAPGLYEAVCRGEMSASKAAIEADFRKRPKPFKQIKRLISKLTPDERIKPKEML
jgi:hypothetical protein